MHFGESQVDCDLSKIIWVAAAEFFDACRQRAAYGFDLADNFLVRFTDNLIDTALDFKGPILVQPRCLKCHFQLHVCMRCAGLLCRGGMPLLPNASTPRGSTMPLTRRHLSEGGKFAHAEAHGSGDGINMHRSSWLTNEPHRSSFGA